MSLAEEEIQRSPLSLWARRIGGAVVVLALVGALVYIVQGLGKKQSGPKRQVVKIAVLPNVPPPPPPPPKQERPPEPKEAPKEIQVEQQVKQVEAPPEPEQLKLEGEAGEGPSAFAAGTVTKDYVGGDIGGGKGGGSAAARLQYGAFNQTLQRYLQEAVSNNKELRRNSYRVLVNLQLTQDIQVQRVDLTGSTGDAELDATLKRVVTAEIDNALKRALADIPVTETPPKNMLQQIRLRISNR